MMLVLLALGATVVVLGIWLYCLSLYTQTLAARMDAVQDEARTARRMQAIAYAELTTELVDRHVLTPEYVRRVLAPLRKGGDA